MAAHWTSEQDAELTRLWLAETPVRDIAKAFHFSTERIAHRRMMLDLPPRPTSSFWPPERLARLRDLHAEGKPYSWIAAQMGVTRSAISGASSRLGLSRDQQTVSINCRRGEARKPRAPKPPKPAPPPRPAPADLQVVPPTARHWETRVFGECSFPVAGEGADTFSCCGAVLDGLIYCGPHWVVAHRPPADFMTTSKLIRSVRRYA